MLFYEFPLAVQTHAFLRGICRHLHFIRNHTKTHTFREEMATYLWHFIKFMCFYVVLFALQKRRYLQWYRGCAPGGWFSIVLVSSEDYFACACTLYPFIGDDFVCAFTLYPFILDDFVCAFTLYPFILDVGDPSYRIHVFFCLLGDPSYRIRVFLCVLGDPSYRIVCILLLPKQMGQHMLKHATIVAQVRCLLAARNPRLLTLAYCCSLAQVRCLWGARPAGRRSARCQGNGASPWTSSAARSWRCAFLAAPQCGKS